MKTISYDLPDTDNIVSNFQETLENINLLELVNEPTPTYNYDESKQINKDKNIVVSIETELTDLITQHQSPELNEVEQTENGNYVVEKNNSIQLEVENQILNEDSQVVLTKKRTRNTDNWKKNKKKLAKNKGEQYVSESGLIEESKLLKTPCINCRFNCSSNITLEIIEKN